MEIVVRAPRRQGSDLLSVGRLIAVGDQTDDNRVLIQLDDGVTVQVWTPNYSNPSENDSAYGFRALLCSDVTEKSNNNII